MLISFNIKNWMSFREEASFSMVASKERQHGDRVPKVSKYQIRLLPISALYGGNASGKTNLFKAMEFAKEFIVNGTDPEGLIPVERFKLSESCLNKTPSIFCFELLIDEIIYEYSFTVNRTQVVEEKLIKITSRNEWLLYHRNYDNINFGEKYSEEEYLKYAFRGTRENQLFLTNAVSQKVETFKPIFDWFKYTLKLITPDSRFAAAEQFLDENNPLYKSINKVLSELDTGIYKYGWIDLPFESISLPSDLKVDIEKGLKSSEKTISVKSNGNEQFCFTRKGEDIEARKLVTFHKSDFGEARFELYEESDGSQRLLDLLPAFIDLKMNQAGSVYVIDELDRSLHTKLTRGLLELFFSACSHETRSQLLLTTHDVMLMDQKLFRRDEMWMTERDENGESTLTPFSDFKNVRYDKDLRKSYLEGRMGGVPHINISTLE